MLLRNAWVGLAGITLALNLVACGGGQETSNKSAEPSSPSGAPAGQKVDTATAGDVKEGDKVTRGQTVGRSDSTGLAGGDHLHFTLLVGGQMVNPVEWWDSHWIEDRVERKLKEAR